MRPWQTKRKADRRRNIFGRILLPIGCWVRGQSALHQGGQCSLTLYHSKIFQSMKGVFIMALTLAEQETVITYDRESDKMSVYTADPVLLRRLMKLEAYMLMRQYHQEKKD